MLWFLLGVATGAVVVAVVLARRGAAGAHTAKSAVPQADEPAVDEPATTAGQVGTALDALPLGVVVFDTRGVEVFRNRAATVGTGQTHGNVLVDATVRRLVTRARDGAAIEEEVKLAGPPATVFVVRASPLPDGGVITTVEDISARSRIDAVRTDFVANVSHELRTPVGAVSVLAETIEGETDDEVVLRLVRRMIDETVRMSRTIDDLLELSRIEMGGDLLAVRVDLDALVDDIAGRFAELASRSGVAIEVVPPRGEDATVDGDPHQLTSALSNLVENAVKYSLDGGKVTISVESLPNSVAVEVRDQGIGIPAASLDRVFERFYRVDRARSRTTGGTGLGLSIVRHIVTNHGGEVNVTSREGEGSTFTVTLPRKAVVAAPMMNSNERGDVNG
ncbi:MAG: sensor histidine kinase [Ilumatobacteraceae bacterium]